MKKKFIISEPVYKSNVTVLIGWTFDELNNFLDKNNYDTTEQKGSEAFALRVEDDIGTSSFLLWVKNFDWTPDDLGRLAHEVFHFVISLTKTKGIKFSADSEECVAYLIDYYFREILKSLKKK